MITWNPVLATFQHQRPLHERMVMDPCTPPADRPAANSTLSSKRKSASPSRDERQVKYRKTSADDDSPHDHFSIRNLTMSFTSNDTTTSDLMAAKQPDSGTVTSKDEPSTSQHLKFSVKEYFAEQRLGLARAARRTSFAHERLAIKLLTEMELFRHALDSEATRKHSLPYRAQQAVALARAAQETLEAEKELAAREAEEARLITKAKEERVEEVDRRLTMSIAQANILSLALRNQHLEKDWVQGPDNIFHFDPTVRHQERWPYPNALENESGSESEHSIVDYSCDPEATDE